MLAFSSIDDKEHTLEGSMRAPHGVRVQSLLVSRLKDCCGQSGSLLPGADPEQALLSAELRFVLKETPQTKSHAYSTDDQGTSILEQNQKANQTDNIMHPRKMTVLAFTLLCKLTWKT